MYRSVLALLFAAVLLLSGCAAGQQTVPKEKSGQETNMDGPAFDRYFSDLYRTLSISYWQQKKLGHPCFAEITHFWRM